MMLLKKILKKSGSIITEDPIYVRSQNPIAKFIIKMDRGNDVREKHEYILLAKKYFKKIKSKIVNIATY